MFRLTKPRLAGVAKDLRHAAPFTVLNALVKILKLPAQQLSQRSAHTAFPGAHESDQDYGPRPSLAICRTLVAKRTLPRRFKRAFGRPLVPIRFSLRFLYCFSERFLRWILPLNVRSTTVEDTATLPMVPAKVRPLSIGNHV